MRIGVEEIRNMLLNYSYEETAKFITEYADTVPGSMQLLDRCVKVMEIYKDELKAGEEFINLYVNHRFDTTKPDIPQLGKRAKNLSKALFKFVVSGMPVESRPEAERKLAICESNECGFFDGSVCRHAQCGCFAKIKVFFETESCPIGKW